MAVLEPETFAEEMVDVDLAPGDTVVCGEHELLSAVSCRVRQHEHASETTAALINQLRGGVRRVEGAE